MAALGPAGTTTTVKVAWAREFSSMSYLLLAYPDPRDSALFSTFGLIEEGVAGNLNGWHRLVNRECSSNG